jgi:3-carboxy-cis,cis-muconate cycloisomerase
MMTGNIAAPLLQALVGDEEVASFFSNDVELTAMLRFEAALAEAECKAGLVPLEAADAIGEACRNLRPDWPALAEGLARDGVVVPALVRQLRGAVGEPHERFVHWGATSQDVVDTGLMLRLKDVLGVILQRLDTIVLALEELRSRDGAVPLMAHTRMQQALPFTAADKLDTWIAPLKRHRERLLIMAPRLLAIQLGGPVGTRAELAGNGDLVALELARLLDLAAVPAWHSQRDRIAEFGSFLSLLSGTLGKIGQDVALMAQNEIGAIRLPSGGGSSAMAHKSNPVAAEILVALARFNAGLLGTLHQAQVHENERSGAAWTLEWMVLPQMAIATAASLAKTRVLIAGASFVASR